MARAAAGRTMAHLGHHGAFVNDLKASSTCLPTSPTLVCCWTHLSTGRIVLSICREFSMHVDRLEECKGWSQVSSLLQGRWHLANCT
jgi:hypothetical protein